MSALNHVSTLELQPIISLIRSGIRKEFKLAISHLT